MRYRVRHETHYRYAEAVANSQHDLHLRPLDSQRQACEAYRLTITPTPSVLQDRVDYFGNHASHLVLSAPHAELRVMAESEVTVAARAPVDAEADLPWEREVERVAGNTADLHALEMTYPSTFITPWGELLDFARPSFPSGRPVLSACLDLMDRIHADFIYDPKATTIATPLPEVLRHRRGVCQDFAHLMLSCLRGLGLSAQYVSGYLVTAPPPGQPRMQGADASHAWLSVYSPQWSWVDLDPTNNVIAGEKHITLAIGRDFGDVTPMRGVILGGGKHDLRVGVDVAPIG